MTLSLSVSLFFQCLVIAAGHLTKSGLVSPSIGAQLCLPPPLLPPRLQEEPQVRLDQVHPAAGKGDGDGGKAEIIDCLECAKFYL